MSTINHQSKHDREGEARDAAAEYERAFHPCGYGTRTAVLPLADGRWQMSATRSDSCD